MTSKKQVVPQTPEDPGIQTLSNVALMRFYDVKGDFDGTPPQVFVDNIESILSKLELNQNSKTAKPEIERGFQLAGILEQVLLLAHRARINLAEQLPLMWELDTRSKLNIPYEGEEDDQ